MAEFLVKIADEQGHLVQQVERGVSESEVRDRFVQQGFLVYWVKPRSMLSQGQIQLPGQRRIKQSTFLIFNQQFLTLIKAGLPILASLDLLIKRQKDSHLRALLENVRDRVKSGEMLSDAFTAQGVFPKIYTTNLMAGEKSGNIEEVLGRYIAFQRMSLTVKKKLIVSLVYPSLLVVVVFFMLIFLISYVVPQFAKLFQDFNAQLPPATVFMLSLGAFAQQYGVYVAIAAADSAVCFLALEEYRSRRGLSRPCHHATADARPDLAEISGFKFLADAGDPVGRRVITGSIS